MLWARGQDAVGRGGWWLLSGSTPTVTSTAQSFLSSYCNTARRVTLVRPLWACCTHQLYFPFLLVDAVAMLLVIKLQWR
jgi:hypothetical protein